MFLRETRRTNRDGSVVSYLQLAHNERHPVSGNPVAKVIHSFGRADQVDRAALARLVSSISRFLTPEQAVTAAAGGRRRGRGAGLAPAGRRRGRWTGSGNASGSARRSAGSPPGGAWTATRSSGWCSRWSRSGRASPARSWPRPAGWPSGSRSRAARGSPTTPRTRRWTSCSTPGRDRRGGVLLGRPPAQS